MANLVTLPRNPRPSYGLVPRAAPLARPSAPRSVWFWGAAAARWLRATARALDLSVRGDYRLHDFAGLIEEARDPSEVETALVRLASEITGSPCVELLLEQGTRVNPGPRRLNRGIAPVAPDPSRPPLRVDLRCGGRSLGTLQIAPVRSRRWLPRQHRQLTTLCRMAAAAQWALRLGRPSEGEFWGQTRAALQGEAFLNTVMPYALAQARRHGEGLALLCVSVDRLAAIRELLGSGLAENAVRLVGATIVRMLRASDIVSRLGDDRLAALLPGAAFADALVVAEAVRAAVAEAGKESQAMPVLTVSVGAASYPEQVRDGSSLVAAASAALAVAQGLGRNRVAAVPDPAAGTSPCPRQVRAAAG
jgi:diguanylate cyclase (GGDEF)-like protein